MAHIISSPTRLKTRRPSGAGSGDILLRHTGMKLQRLCVCLVPTKCASVCVRACVRPRSCLWAAPALTEIGSAIIVVPIWWKHYSFDVILYRISLWQAIREGDELFFRPRGGEEEGERKREGGSLLFGAAVRNTGARRDQAVVSLSSFFTHPHEETSESLINFRIINLWPFWIGESWACGESLSSLWIYTNAFLQRTEQSFWVLFFVIIIYLLTVGNEWADGVW